MGRSRQSFSQFCSNFSSGHFAAQEGKKAAHNICWRKKDKEEEGRSNSEFHRIGQTGGWLTPQEEDNSESQILWQCGKFGDIRAVWWGWDRHCGTISKLFHMLVCMSVCLYVYLYVCVGMISKCQCPIHVILSVLHFRQYRAGPKRAQRVLLLKNNLWLPAVLLAGKQSSTLQNRKLLTPNLGPTP